MHESADKFIQHFSLNTEERRLLDGASCWNCGLLYDAFGVADYVSSNVRMADKLEGI
jgi:hypothetical protein